MTRSRMITRPGLDPHTVRGSSLEGDPGPVGGRKGGGQITQDDRLREALAAMDPSGSSGRPSMPGHGDTEVQKSLSRAPVLEIAVAALARAVESPRAAVGPTPRRLCGARRPGRGLRGCPRGGEARSRWGSGAWGADARPGRLQVMRSHRSSMDAQQPFDSLVRVHAREHGDLRPQSHSVTCGTCPHADRWVAVLRRERADLRHYDSLGLVRQRPHAVGYREYADDLRRSFHLKRLSLA